MLPVQLFISELDLKNLASNPLFKGVSPSHELLNSLSSKKSAYHKGDILFHEGDELHSFGIILEGTAEAHTLDSFGKKLIIANLPAGAVLGGILSVGNAQKSPVTVRAASELIVLFIPANAVLVGFCSHFDPNSLLLRNLLNIISEKFFELHERINCIMRPTLREKVLFYLDNCAKRAGKNEFDIPFNRQALAEYLNADRSALSRELSKMKTDGLVDFSAKSFIIKTPDTR